MTDAIARPVPLHMRRNGLDPVPELAEVREREGVRRITTALGMAAWLVTRPDDVRQVLSDATRFSNASALIGLPEPSDEQERARSRAGLLLVLDPPEHSRLRRMLTPEFTAGRMRRLGPRVAAIVDEHLDVLAAAGPPVDLVPAFALPVPALVICELLGVPVADRDSFQRRAGRQFDLSLPVDELRRAAVDSRAYMRSLVVAARTDPGEDLLGMLVREHGDDVTDDELVGIGALLLVAGHETTSTMLSLGLLALLRHPAQLALVRHDPAAAGPAVEELLRYLSVVHTGVARCARTDLELAGQRIAAGDLLLCSLPSVNRAVGERPDELDVARGAPGHVAFGHGVHHCIGAPLARMELRIAIPALLRRFPGLALAVPDDELRYRELHTAYGVHALPVTW